MNLVYMHRCPNGKVYIGKTSGTIESRAGVNGRRYVHGHFHNAIKKYGWDNIEHIVLKDGLTDEEACIYEQEMIAKYESFNPDKGYNITLGGEGMVGVKLSDETKEKLRQANLGKKQSKETIDKRVSHYKGKPRSEEVKKKISESHKGVPLSEEHKQRLKEAAKNRKSSKGHKRKPLSEEHKQKLREACKKYWNTGDNRKKFSEKMRKVKSHKNHGGNNE